jgi:hypothetical protein
MAVPILTPAGPRSTFEHGAPRPLFKSIPIMINLPHFSYMPSLDGQRFLVAVPTASAIPLMTVVMNWQSALKR